MTARQGSGAPPDSTGSVCRRRRRPSSPQSLRLSRAAPSGVRVCTTVLAYRWLVMRPASRSSVVWWLAVVGVTPACRAASVVVAPVAAARRTAARVGPSRPFRGGTGDGRRDVLDGVEQDGREAGVGQGDGGVPAEVGGDQQQSAPVEVDVAAPRVARDLQDRVAPADRGRQAGEHGLAPGAQQRPGVPGPLGVQALVDVLLVRGDHGTVVGAQGVHELSPGLPLGHPVRPGRAAHRPAEPRHLVGHSVARGREDALQTGVQAVDALGRGEEVREVAGPWEERQEQRHDGAVQAGPVERRAGGAVPERVRPAAVAGLETVQAGRDLPQRVRPGRHSEAGQVLRREMKAEHPIPPSLPGCHLRCFTPLA